MTDATGPTLARVFLKNPEPLPGIRPILWAVAMLIPAGPLYTHAAEPARATSEWVYFGPDGRLLYKKTPAGDRIMDFSHAGYMGGGVALPSVPAKQTVRPSGNGRDDTAAIQAAIDAVSAMPRVDGFRGAVLLEPGVFSCSRTLTVSADGVVLRGSGSGADGGPRTTIKMTGRPHLALAIRAPSASGRGRPSSNLRPAGTAADFTPAETFLADAYVPSGTTTFTVASAAGFAVGDVIEIRRPVTDAWIRFMGMHDLVRDGRPQTWLRAGGHLVAERRIAAIAGNVLTVDAPLSDSYDSRYLNPPGTAVVKIRPPARVAQSGIEHLHIESPPQPISHTQPHFTALRISGEDCWVRDVVIEETMNSVAVGGRRITLERVTINRKARHQGSSR
ncbi:MAG: hypothetical protein N3D11_11395, partial [Candidatus Sumerlaeia bacterium]|nr:hypothetical protein [Candidatus Sumerlaeia bacterium]